MSNQELALYLKGQQKSLASILPKQIPTEQFFRTILMACDNNPKLYDADYESLMIACRKAALDGLLLDNREAALVPFKNNTKGIVEITYMPMYQGLLKKIRQSGLVSTIIANVVYENDEFDYYVDENGPKMLHRPTFEDRGNKRLVYAHAKLKDDSIQVEILTPADVNHIKKSSKTATFNDSPWKHHEAEMWRKTALRRIAKYLPTSAELERLYQSDNEDYRFDKALDVTPPTNTNEQTSSLEQQSMLDALASKFEPNFRGDDKMNSAIDELYSEIKG